MRTNRRDWMMGLGGLLVVGAARGAEGVAAVATDAGVAGGVAEPTAPPRGFPAQDSAMVRQVVGASHFDLEKVRELVEPRPELALAAWDWGFGDWESALGAASHTGRVEIARYLMSHGARPDVFTFAMLGHLAAVRACLEAQPSISSAPGPHGITLLSHARAGGEPAAGVVAYLESLGDADPTPHNVELDEAIERRLLGAYRGDGDLEALVDRQRSGILGVAVGDGASRALFHQGDLVFHPAGAPSVAIAFLLRDREVDLEFRIAEGTVRAHRVGDLPKA